jgi:hypothetical protein
MSYFHDGSIEAACPPLKALLNIMAFGEYDGMCIDDERIRIMFTRDYLFSSDWYKQRLITKQLSDIALWERHIAYLNQFIQKSSHQDVVNQLKISERLITAEKILINVKSPDYLKDLCGTIGLDPLFRNKTQ